MIKYIDVPIKDNNGDATVIDVGGGSFEKTASYESYPEGFKEYIESIKAKPDKATLLVSALGDWNWGNNKNADLWPRQGLENDTPAFGYKTYEMIGKWYHNHKNKDPKYSFGDVVKSFWDARMGRVLVIVEVDLNKDIETKLDLMKNTLIPTSIGARVKYDICNVCHPNFQQFYNIPEPEMIIISKSHNLKEIHNIGKKNGVNLEYISELKPEGGPVGIRTKTTQSCVHMKHYKNKLMPNGIRVAVANLRPRFFDISRVRRGADKSSYVLMKVAEDDDMIWSDEEFKDMLVKEQSELMKKVSTKTKKEKAKDSRIKKEDNKSIEKESPGNGTKKATGEQIRDYFDENITPDMRFREKELPNSVIEDLTKFPISEIISTFSGMGMFPHPREFQRIILIQSGRRDLDRKLEDMGINITEADVRKASPVSHDGIVVSKENVNDDIVEMLMEFLPHRSYHRPYVIRRIGMMKTGSYPVNRYSNPVVQETIRNDHNPSQPVLGILGTLAAMYGLSRTKAGKGMKETMSTLSKKKKLISAGVLGTYLASLMVNSSQQERENNIMSDGGYEFSKSAGVAKHILPLGAPIGSYIYSGHLINKSRQGKSLNSAEKFVVKHPLLTGIAGGVGLHGPSRKALFGTIGSLSKGISKIGSAIDDLPFEEQDMAIIQLWEETFVKEKE